MKLAGSRLFARDRAWCLSANRWGARQTVRAYFRFVSRLGDGEFWVALIALLALCDGWRGLGASAHLAVLAAVNAALYRKLKRWTRRPRPFAADCRIQPWIAPLDEFSFPSGHTLHAISFTWIASAYYPMLAWVLVPFTLSVAASRVVLGMHYPSDVLAASAIGATLAATSMWLASSMAVAFAA